jgi:hypothetical protein
MVESATVDADILELPIAHRLELAQRGRGAVTLAKTAEKLRYPVEFGVLRFAMPARQNGQCYACHLLSLSSSAPEFGGAPTVLQLPGSLWYLPQTFARSCQNSNMAEDRHGAWQIPCEPAWYFAGAAVEFAKSL